MIRILAAGCALSLALTSALPAQAWAAGPPDGAVYNIMGSSKCAAWPRKGSVESAAKAVPLNWVLGYLSNEAETSDTRLFAELDPVKLGAFLDTYCADHPDHALPTAAKAWRADMQDELGPPVREAPMFSPPMSQQVKPAAKPKAPAKKPAARKPAARK